ncbi:MAG: hypothetical protein PHG16_07170 [Lachnospiraceae bacterium]|nr:hypothetical protein [Lachnospiraceae bacterium]
MNTIETYIAMRKKRDKMNEFDFSHHSENMGKVIQYVTDYFNDYLNLEDFSQEQAMAQQAVERFREGVMERHPLSYSFIIDYYMKTRKRIDTLAEKAYQDFEDGELFYTDEDFQKIAEHLCKKKLLVEPETTFLEQLKIVIRECRMNTGEAPSNADMKELDNALIDWVKETFRTYGVNLLNYVSAISYDYEEKYVKTIYDRPTETFYHINQYEYRYQENPFDINDIYERNKHRVFIKDKKGELEMLIMYCWLFEDIHDEEYWPEYVKLCIESQRVHIVQPKGILLPVRQKGMEYPCDILAYINYAETKTGILKESPGENYVLKIIYEKEDDAIWKDLEKMELMIQNLQKSFKTFGAPRLLEFQSPYSSTFFNKSDFFLQYGIFEKGMKRYTKMKIALVNGYRRRNKEREYMVSSIEDIVKLRNACREMKLHLKIAVDFTDTGNKNGLKKNINETVNALAEMRAFIVAVHLKNIDDWHGYRNIYRDDKGHRYMGITGDAPFSEFLSGLRLVLQDNRERFLIPQVKSEKELRDLTDMLLRGGCYFKSEVTSDANKE